MHISSSDWARRLARPLLTLHPVVPRWIGLLVLSAQVVIRLTDLCSKGRTRRSSGKGRRIRQRTMECIILSVNDTYMDAQEVMHMTDYSKITALYSRLSVGDEDRDGGESRTAYRTKKYFWRTMPEGST